MGFCLLLLIYRVLYIAFYLLKSIFFRMKWFVTKCRQIKGTKNKDAKSLEKSKRKQKNLGVILEQSEELDDEEVFERKQNRRERSGISRYQRVEEIGSPSPIKKHNRDSSHSGIQFNPTDAKMLNNQKLFQMNHQIEVEK